MVCGVRRAAGVALCALLALLVAGEARPAGAAGRATPPGPDPLVYLRYSGTFDGTQTTKQTPTQKTKNVSRLEWDLR
jgi:hypothetical protein